MPMTTASPVMNLINTLSVPASGGAAMGSTPARSPGAKAGESAPPDSFSRALNQANDQGSNAQRSSAPHAQVSNRPERVDVYGKGEATATDNTEGARGSALAEAAAAPVDDQAGDKAGDKAASPEAAVAAAAAFGMARSPDAPALVPVEPATAPDVSTLLSGWIAQNPIGRLPEPDEAEAKTDPKAPSVPTLGLVQTPPDAALGALPAPATGEPRQAPEARPAPSARRAVPAPVASAKSDTLAATSALTPSTTTQADAMFSNPEPLGLARIAAPAQGVQANGTESGAANALGSVAALNKQAAPTLLEGRLAASPGSTEFAPQLSVQLSLLVRAGVHQARLQLNPAEMGPLSLQIQLDGSAAQVRMAAEHPLTRQALEQAMPQLASALRDMGLTLTGGGVFDQARDNPARDAQGGPGKPGGAATEAQAEGRPLAVAALRQRGVVDLVA